MILFPFFIIKCFAFLSFCLFVHVVPFWIFDRVPSLLSFPLSQLKYLHFILEGRKNRLCLVDKYCHWHTVFSQNTPHFTAHTVYTVPNLNMWIENRAKAWKKTSNGGWASLVLNCPSCLQNLKTSLLAESPPPPPWCPPCVPPSPRFCITRGASVSITCYRGGTPHTIGRSKPPFPPPPYFSCNKIEGIFQNTNKLGPFSKTPIKWGHFPKHQ